MYFFKLGTPDIYFCNYSDDCMYLWKDAMHRKGRDVQAFSSEMDAKDVQRKNQRNRRRLTYNGNRFEVSKGAKE